MNDIKYAVLFLNYKYLYYLKRRIILEIKEW